MTLKSEVEAARARHEMRCLDMRMGRAYGRGAIEASRRLMEREIAAIRRRAANDNEKRLSRCAGIVTDENPLTGKEKINGK